MTDFVAVIRRAVDGLKDNNPDMRAKVYEKARAAVLKQLENMKPRPTDDVISRQMAKLDDAVLSVENEYADALPEEAAIFGSSQKEPVTKMAEPARIPDPAVPNFDTYVQTPTTQTVQPTSTWEPVSRTLAASDLLWVPEEPVNRRATQSFDEASPRNTLNSRSTGTAAAATVSMPEATSDIPWDVSPFDEDTQKPNSARSGSGENAASKFVSPQAIDDDWDSKDDLADFESTLRAASKTGPQTVKNKASDVEKIVSKLEGKSFKAQAKTTKINYAGLVAGLAGLIIVGVGGYGVWHYRDSIMSLVNSTTPPATVQNASTKATSPDKPSTAPAASDQTKQTQIAAANSKDAAGSGKFTQRLLPDGSETSEALTNAPKPEGKEGKSIAEQTVKGKDVASVAAPAAAGSAPAPTAAPALASNTQPTTPTSTDVQTPAATAEVAAPATANAAPAQDPNSAAETSQKMFLYEERLGQASPTAVNGTVIWSVANDTTATDGKPQSEIQAKITVPERGMSALITFKRNTDKSLPASHVVELVFSLPKDFDGGGIDSVQRIAMKQNEQDRGNSLIAVPAKITDDFHMIALNDDPAAVSSNSELLKNRNWIDIPITYRNGRRALITIEKGPDGSADFNKVMAEWAALSPA